MPELRTVVGCFGFGLAVDVEEWYHTCLVPEYVDPERRPPLVEELDTLLPNLLELLAAARCQATFFVLGEVAKRLPARIRELAAAGHEVACHGYSHLRANQQEPEHFASSVKRAKLLLEEIVGAEVQGFRAPEWSLRGPDNPRFAALLDLGFHYDSSLVPSIGSGRPSNPVLPTRLQWKGGREILELPPLTWGGALRLPATGWTGRLAPPEWIAHAARRLQICGGLPLLTVHPWELVARPTPGDLVGLARFVHDTGRPGFAGRFRELLGLLPWESLQTAWRRGVEETEDTIVERVASGARVDRAPNQEEG